MSTNDGIVLETKFNAATTNRSPDTETPPVLAQPIAKTNYFRKYGPFGLLVILLIIILIIVAVIVARLNHVSPIGIETTMSTTIRSTTSKANGESRLEQSIVLENMLVHLRQFESRVMGSEAFNRTVDYLVSKLQETNTFTVEKFHFSVPRSELAGPPLLLALPNTSNASIFLYPRDLTTVDRSTEASNWSVADGKPLSIVEKLGCSPEDWKTIKPGDVALVRRGKCTFYEKIYSAINRGASACLIFNDGLNIDRLEPLNYTRAPRNNTIPVLFLSYEAGMRLIQNNITHVYLKLEFRALPPAIVTNVCGNTKFGDIHRTIVIGSHSDSVAAGSGLNDNGSGMAATLAIALNLARLIRETDYAEHVRSRLKFCWWGGEEAGLLGSTDFVRRAKADGSLKMYSVNLNFDMLGSPNFIFGIYDGKTADNATTPVRAIPGSHRITKLFVEFFDRQRLPWDYTDFSGRSDYGPFLAEGIACGGLFSGADDIKTQEQRDRYLRMLGSTLGGMANTDLDPCYHKKCDTLENLNMFAYLHMVKAAAHSIEFLAHLQDLNQWLYPSPP